MTRLQCQLGHPILLSIYKKMLSACNMNRFFLFPSPDRTGKTIHGGSLGPEELHWLGSARSSSVTAPRTRGLVVEGNFSFFCLLQGRHLISLQRPISSRKTGNEVTPTAVHNNANFYTLSLSVPRGNVQLLRIPDTAGVCRSDPAGG